MCCCVICGCRKSHLRVTNRCVSLRRTILRRVSCRMTNHLREEHSSSCC